MNDSGAAGSSFVRIAFLNSDRTEATVTVPLNAATGEVTAFGTDTSFLLQIVPRITSSTLSSGSLTPGQNLRLDGSGFIEGGSTVRFGDVDVVDPDNGSGTINVFSTNRAINVTIPNGAGPEITVTTAGGTSNLFVVE